MTMAIQAPMLQRAAVPHDAPTRRHYSVAAILYGLVAIYGSFVPFDFHAHPIGQAWRYYRAQMSASIAIESLSDWGANILLFVPLAFLAMGATCLDRKRVAASYALPLIVIGAVLLSAAIEFGQVFSTYRVVSPSDLVAETLGACLGAAVWIAAGQRGTDGFRRLARMNPFRGRLGALAILYLGALFVIGLMPLDLTLSPRMVWRKYRRGQLHLLPFDQPQATLAFVAVDVLETFVCFLPAGLLLAAFSASVPRSRAGWGTALCLGTLLAAALEFGQLLVVGRHVVASDIPLGVLAVLVGWVLGSRALAGRPLHSIAPRAWIRFAQVGATAWSLLLIGVDWQPFDFEFSSARLSQNLSQMSWIPFADYESQANLSLISELAEKGASFFVLGGLVALATVAGREVARRAAMAAGLAATVIETGQLFLSTRHPSITDLAFAMLAAAIGAVVVSRLLAGAGPEAGRGAASAAAPGSGRDAVACF